METLTKVQIDADGGYVVDDNGVQESGRASDVQAAKHAVLARMRDAAVRTGSPVRVRATAPDGVVVLDVSPSGHVQAAPPEADVTPAPAQTVSAAPPQTMEQLVTRPPMAAINGWDLVSGLEAVRSSTGPVAEAQDPGRPAAWATAPQVAPRGLFVRRADKEKAEQLAQDAQAEVLAAQEYRQAAEAVRRGLYGSIVIPVLGPKGGSGKTLSALSVGRELAVAHPGRVLVMCANPARGTLGERVEPAGHGHTVADLLADLERFESGDAGAGELSRYVWRQSGGFDVLASDTVALERNPRTADELGRLLKVLRRLAYSVIVLDTGNDETTELWTACVDLADQMLLVTTVAEDHVKVLAGMAERLVDLDYTTRLQSAVTVLMPSVTDHGVSYGTTEFLKAAFDRFGAVTSSVLRAPYDPAAAGGVRIRHEEISMDSRRAWMQVAADLIRIQGRR